MPHKVLSILNIISYFIFREINHGEKNMLSDNIMIVIPIKEIKHCMGYYLYCTGCAI